MTYGLKIYDASGRIRVDIDNRFPKIYYVITVPAINSGSPYVINLPMVRTDGRWFVEKDGHASQPIQIDINDGSIRVIHWLAGANSPFNMTVYGW